MKKTYLLALFAVLLFSSFNPKGLEIAIILNNENKVSSLNESQTKLYWLRKIKKRWPEINKNIKPVDRKSKCPEQDLFYSKVLGMSANEVEAYFTQKQYESAEKPQDKFANDNEIINFVNSEIGAIGFVNVNSLSGENKSKVKVVLTVQ
ncbi:MAG: hypothetical protein SNJ77_03300 [Cytophagales bacterium]